MAGQDADLPFVLLGRPQCVRSRSDRIIETARNFVEILVKEVRVDVERHRRFRVPEHPLHCLHIGIVSRATIYRVLAQASE